MISSFSFLYLRSCAGDSDSFCIRLAMSWSCSLRSFLYSLATVSKVSSTFGFSSSSIAASDIVLELVVLHVGFGGEFGRTSFSSVAPAGAALNGVRLRRRGGRRVLVA
jgi:hypothetical protein